MYNVTKFCQRKFKSKMGGVLYPMRDRNKIGAERTYETSDKSGEKKFWNRELELCRGTVKINLRENTCI